MLVGTRMEYELADGKFDDYVKHMTDIVSNGTSYDQLKLDEFKLIRMTITLVLLMYVFIQTSPLTISKY